MSEQEIYKIIAGIADLKRGQIDHATQLEKMNVRLFGNGQPGELGKIEMRLTALEKFRYTLMGGAMALGTLGAILEDVLRWFLRVGHR